MERQKRLGVFGWGIVAPKSPDIDRFERNLRRATSWLAPFDGFGPNNFLVGKPEFDFSVYKPWIDERFEPRKFAQIDAKMGGMVKYAIGAFIQALGQNPGLEDELQRLGSRCHIYVGTGLGDLPLQYEIARQYDHAERAWRRFWCRDEHNPLLAEFRCADPATRETMGRDLGVPQDPSELEADDPGLAAATEEWLTFWVQHSEGLKRYLAELQGIEGEGIEGDIEAGKGGLIRRKMAACKKLNARYGCPVEPWNAVDANLLWNIANIPAAQISMLGRITGPAIAPIAACSGFGTALSLADNAIQLGQAKAVVVGMTDPEPHALTVGAFYRARVLSQDGRVSKPFTEMRGTHISGGACVWIVGDADYFMGLGMKPLGLEIIGTAMNSDADHIITPSKDGPIAVIREALSCAGVAPEEVETWDLHATATPGDWTEFENARSIFPPTTRFTARKGTFGHGMSVCGGWELTAQHLGVATGRLHPVDLHPDEVHPRLRQVGDVLVKDASTLPRGSVAGKINMGIGGANTCVISRPWPEDKT